MSKDFTSLKNMREGWVEATKKNGFKIRQVLTENYPDNAHFIYELLQNAEDKEASEVCFTLNNERLDFEHNGSRLFSLKDIESITGIGVSSKRDEPTSIGKFGVGFKAAFVYTNTPEIHSGDYHFKIQDLVVPKEIVSQQRTEKTQFIFPFDRPEKKKTQARDEIIRGLRELGDNTLLFLKHIHKIQYQLPDGSIGTIERIEHDDGCIEICSIQLKKKKTSSYWLRFEKYVEVADEDEKQKDCRIAIAYCLVKEERKKKQSKWKIVPLDRGEVSIYFPAKKEASNLHFHIHAPFASTIARDSIRDVQANKDLRDHLAKLVVESLETIRYREMLNVSFLAVLPNHDDNLLEFYEPIRKAIVEAFCKTDLTPTRSGDNRSAVTLYRGPAKIADVLGDKGLSILTEFSEPLWAANAPQENQREDRFIHSLKIDEWGWNELVSIFEKPHPYAWDENEKTENAKHQERIKTFIHNLSDAELMRFYALLGEAVDTHHKSVDIEGLPIVRVTRDGVNQHVAPEEAYLPSEAETSSPSDVFFVKPEVYSVGRSDSQKKYAKSFLGEIGVRSYDEKTAVEKILKEHYSEINFKPSMKDLKRFIALLGKETDKASLFAPYRIFECQDREWRKPSEIYLDHPFMVTGLSAYYDVLKESATRFSLAKSYENCGIEIIKLGKFAESVGVQTQLEITETRCSNNPDWSRLRRVNIGRAGKVENDDWEIKSLELILKIPSLPISKLIWKCMCSLPEHPDHLKAIYQRSETIGPAESASTLVHQLRAAAWVPQGDERFVCPADAVSDSLPKGFPFDSGWQWLEAIGFGEEVAKQSEEYHQKQIAAKKFGFDNPEEVDIWKKVRDSGASPEEILAQQAQQKRISQPVDSVKDPDRRQKKVLADIADAPSKESVKRERSIQKGISEVTAKAKAYLRTKYRNTDDQLVCQCCHNEMPFKLRSKEYYFEAVQCIDDKEIRHFRNRLALCPNCAAMYQHARETDDAEIRRRIVEHEADNKATAVEISVQLAGRELTLRFVGSHWFDLKNILSEELFLEKNHK